MKVLHIISSLETGGAQKLLSELLPELKILDVDVELVVFRKTGSRFEKQIENAGIPLHSLGIESNYSPAAMCFIARSTVAWSFASVNRDTISTVFSGSARDGASTGTRLMPLFTTTTFSLSPSQ